MDFEGPFTSYNDVFSWLSRFINFERGQTGKSFRLDRMEYLAERTQHPERACPVIHVAGSKGKGSVTTMIAGILTAGGYKTGKYVSPHVTEYRERIALASAFFDPPVYVRAGEELRALVDQITKEAPVAGSSMASLFDGFSAQGEEPTFFELLTLYFFLCAREASCTAVAVETGMGGRLDATNIVDPEVSVIMPIEMEHTEYLGSTLHAIAGEKAGIIKYRRPVVVAEQEPEALEVFKNVARQRDSSLRYLPQEVRLDQIRVDQKGTSARLRYTDRAIFPHPLELRLKLVGEIQAYNAAAAILAAKIGFPDLEEDAILRGLQEVQLPARFEKIQDDPPVIIDGAHTPKSVSLCRDTFSALYGSQGILLFACAIDKDSLAMARLLVPYFSTIIITAPGTFKKSDPPSVYRHFISAESAGRSTILLEPDTQRAIELCVHLGMEKGAPTLVTGSFYLAAAVRSYGQNR